MKQKSNKQLCEEIQKTAKWVIDAANKKGISDIPISCVDRELMELYDEQKEKKERGF